MKKMLTMLLIVSLLTLSCALAESEPTVYTSGDWQYTWLRVGVAEIVRYTGTETEVVVPAEIDGSLVTSIGTGPFTAAPR